MFSSLNGSLLYNQCSTDLVVKSSINGRELAHFGKTTCPLEMCISSIRHRDSNKHMVATFLLHNRNTLEIHVLLDESYEIVIDHTVHKLFASTEGIIMEISRVSSLQDEVFSNGIYDIFESNLLYLSHPLSKPYPVYHTNFFQLSHNIPNYSNEMMILGIRDNIIITMDSQTSYIHLFYLATSNEFHCIEVSYAANINKSIVQNQYESNSNATYINYHSPIPTTSTIQVSSHNTVSSSTSNRQYLTSYNCDTSSSSSRHEHMNTSSTIQSLTDHINDPIITGFTNIVDGSNTRIASTSLLGTKTSFAKRTSLNASPTFNKNYTQETSTLLSARGNLTARDKSMKSSSLMNPGSQSSKNRISSPTAMNIAAALGVTDATIDSTSYDQSVYRERTHKRKLSRSVLTGSPTLSYFRSNSGSDDVLHTNKLQSNRYSPSTLKTMQETLGHQSMSMTSDTGSPRTETPIMMTSRFQQTASPPTIYDPRIVSKIYHLNTSGNTIHTPQVHKIISSPSDNILSATKNDSQLMTNTSLSQLYANTLRSLSNDSRYLIPLTYVKSDDILRYHSSIPSCHDQFDSHNQRLTATFHGSSDSVFGEYIHITDDSTGELIQVYQLSYTNTSAGVISDANQNNIDRDVVIKLFESRPQLVDITSHIINTNLTTISTVEDTMICYLEQLPIYSVTQSSNIVKTTIGASSTITCTSSIANVTINLPDSIISIYPTNTTTIPLSLYMYSTFQSTLLDSNSTSAHTIPIITTTTDNTNIVSKEDKIMIQVLLGVNEVITFPLSVLLIKANINITKDTGTLNHFKLVTVEDGMTTKFCLTRQKTCLENGTTEETSYLFQLNDYILSGGHEVITHSLMSLIEGIQLIYGNLTSLKYIPPPDNTTTTTKLTNDEMNGHQHINHMDTTTTTTAITLDHNEKKIEIHPLGAVISYVLSLILQGYQDDVLYLLLCDLFHMPSTSSSNSNTSTNTSRPYPCIHLIDTLKIDDVASLVFDILHMIRENLILRDGTDNGLKNDSGLLRGLVQVASLYTHTNIGKLYLQYYSQSNNCINNMVNTESFGDLKNTTDFSLIPIFTNNNKVPNTLTWLNVNIQRISTMFQSSFTTATTTTSITEYPNTTHTCTNLLGKLGYPFITKDANTNKINTYNQCMKSYSTIILTSYLLANIENWYIEQPENTNESNPNNSHNNGRSNSSSSSMILAQAFINTIHTLSHYSSDNANKSFDINTMKIQNQPLEKILDLFPITLQSILKLSLHLCQDKTMISTWPINILQYIHREDLVYRHFPLSSIVSLSTTRFKAHSTIASTTNASANSHITNTYTNNGTTMITNGSNTKTSTSNTTPDSDSDGLIEIEQASYEWFPEDERVHEVCRMLKTSKHIYLRVIRTPELSDIEYREKQQIKLLNLTRRVLGCCVGRGMVTLATWIPLLAEPLPIPTLCITGRCAPNNVIMPLETTTPMTDLLLWPEFHNGVAAGLRVGFSTPTPLEIHRHKMKMTSSIDNVHVHDVLQHHTSSSRNRIASINRDTMSSQNTTTTTTTITRNWIMYNRTHAQNTQRLAAHAGVILALGLQGHLTPLTMNDICDYLTKGHEPTTMSILIGISASKLGTADPWISKTLCLHIPSLLPPLQSEIEISSLIQASAFTGIGLLYCQTGHRLMTELLLDELMRKPTSTESYENREAVALSASWALGMILLCKGASSSSSSSSLSSSYTVKSKQVTQSSNVESSKLHTSQIPQHQQQQQQQQQQQSSHSQSSSTDQENKRLPVHHHQVEEVADLKGLSDLYIEDKLHLLIHGGPRPSNTILHHMLASHHLSAEKNTADANTRSSLILENEYINTDVTAVGAILALAMIYMKSNNRDMANIIKLPQTALSLDKIRPDILLYRSLGRCMILWDEVQVTESWFNQQIPQVIKSRLFDSEHASSKIPIITATKGDGTENQLHHPNIKHSSTTGSTSTTVEAGATSSTTTTTTATNTALNNIEARLAKYHMKSSADSSNTGTGKPGSVPHISAISSTATNYLSYDTALVLYLNTLAGIALGIGLIYAGTADKTAENLLYDKLIMLQCLREGKIESSIFHSKVIIDRSVKPTLESSLCTVALSLACIMAGTGDIRCLRLLRELRWKVDDINHGTHMALNMAIGLLFLSGGTASLRRKDPVSTACLLLSILPRYPSRTIDNHYHTQLLRHLYVISIERRAFQTLDMDTYQSIKLYICILMKNGSILYRMTPCMLPELCDIDQVLIYSSYSDYVTLVSQYSDTITHTNNNNHHIHSTSSTSSSTQQSTTNLSLQDFESCQNMYYFPMTFNLSADSSSSSFSSKVYLKRRPISSKSIIIENSQLGSQICTNISMMSRINSTVFNHEILRSKKKVNPYVTKEISTAENSTKTSQLQRSNMTLHSIITDIANKTLTSHKDLLPVKPNNSYVHAYSQTEIGNQPSYYLKEYLNSLNSAATNDKCFENISSQYKMDENKEEYDMGNTVMGDDIDIIHNMKQCNLFENVCEEAINHL